MQTKNRNIYFDNLKTILIVLVVLGHFTNLNRTNLLMGAINNVIYSFHMPVFIFISGYFSKSISSQRFLEIENILYPFIVFQFISFAFTKITGFGFDSINIFIPTYQNWYLLGLFFWRTIIPYYKFFNKKFSFFFTIILALVIGFFDGFNDFLGLYRIIYYFPIFLLGYICSDLQIVLQKISNYKYFFICISLIFLFIIFALSLYNIRINNIFFSAFTPITNYNHKINMLFTRMSGYLISIIISIGLLFLIPVKRYKFTYIGENTMNIFLLHMFLVFPINACLSNIPNYLILIISLTSSLLISLLLSFNIINKI